MDHRPKLIVFVEGANHRGKASSSAMRARRRGA